MKIKHLLIGLFAVAAAVACKQEEPVVTPKLDVDKTAVQVAATAGEASFNVTSNQSWVATADADWVSLEPASGQASEKAVAVKVTAEDNETTEARKATVTVKAGELTKTVEVNQAAGAGEEPGPGPELPQSEWALVGTFGESNNWNPASDLYLSVLDEEYFVYYGFELTATTEFKFLKGGAWPDDNNDAMEIGGNGLVEPNTIQPAGGSNIKVTEAGKYDIYLAADLTKFYIMSEGKLPSEATEPAPVENQWSMMGCFVDNQWSSDVPMTKEGEWIVAKGAQFTELTFKIRANQSWSDPTNIGLAPGSERGVVNGKISVVTAEYSKANLGGDAADIKLNGEAGTYDVYFSFENLEVYVMEEGFKPGEKEPQNPEPVEITYTVAGTIADNVWANNAAVGLMAAEGDYLVAKNIPFVWNSTCYGGDYNRIEFKIVETGTWNGYAYPEKNIDQYANAEITVSAGGENIAVDAPEGNYDVYFDKANKKVWVMEAGYKPGDEVPVVPAPGDFDIDGKQWVFTWEAMGVPAVFDLGVTAPGEFYFAFDMSALDEAYAGVWYPYYSGTYTVEKKDGTTGVLKVTLIDPLDGTELAAEIPYTMTAEHAATFDTSAIKAQLEVESVSATVSSELIDLTGGQGGEAEGLADGEYWIISGGKVATPISEAGNLPTVDAVDGKSTASNAFKFTLVDETEYLYSIKDSKGMYLYLTEDEKFAVSADNDDYSDPYCWQVMGMPDGTFYIANFDTMGTIQLATDGTYVCAQSMVGTYPALVLAENPLPEPEPEPEGPQAISVADFLNLSVGTTEYQLTGVMEDTYNTTYGNFYLNDGTGKVVVYGLTKTKVSSNDMSFASLGLKDGDTITIIGTRDVHNGTAQVGGPAYLVSCEKTAAWDAPAISFVNNIVTLVSNEGAAIYYTLDGTTPSESSQKYSEPFEIQETVTVNAIAVKEGRPNSSVATKECEYVEISDDVVVGGAADFATISATNTQYVTGTTTAGWNYKNCAIFKGGTSDSSPAFKMIGDASNRALCMNGKTSAVGSITSPTLTTGCGTLTFNYGLPFNDTQIKFRVDIMQNGSVVKTFTINNASATKLTKYSHSEAINVSGDFQIVFTNLSPSNNSTSNKDRTAIWDVEWTGYKE